MGTDSLQTVDIIRNAEIVHSFEPANDTFEATWTDPEPDTGGGYYYVRVIQTDGEIAWGTPIWFVRS